MNILKKNFKLLNGRFPPLLLKSFFLFILLFILFPWVVHGTASYHLSPSSGTYETNNVFSTDVLIRGSGDTVKGTIIFDRDLLEVQSISEARSVVEMWSPGGRPRYSNTEGTISFSGGITGGITGSQANIITINFRPKKVGQASVTFLDGDILSVGESIISQKEGAVYTLKEGTSDSTPTPDSQGPLPSFDDFSDNEEDSSEKFTIEIDNEGDPTNPTPIFIFKKDPDLPETDYYETILNNELHEVFFFEEGDVLNGEKRHRISFLSPGSYTLEVRAFDKNDNYISSFISFSILPIFLEIEEISLPKQEEEPTKILGRTIPGATVKIYLTPSKEDSLISEKILIEGFEKEEGRFLKEIIADNEGYFYLEIMLLPGDYQLQIQSEDERGALSEIIETTLNVNTGQDIWFIILISLLSVLIFGGIFLAFFLKRKRKKKKKTKKEKEGNHMPEKEKDYIVLREKVKEQVNYLENKADLNRGEAKILKELKDALEESSKEKEIKKEE